MRVWFVSGKKVWLGALIFGLSIIQLAGGFALVSYITTINNIIAISGSIELGSCDIIISASLWWYLGRARGKVFSRTRKAVDVLILKAVNIGILTKQVPTIVALTNLVTWLVIPPTNFSWTVFHISLGKIYVNSMLVSFSTMSQGRMKENYVCIIPTTDYLWQALEKSPSFQRIPRAEMSPPFYTPDSANPILLSDDLSALRCIRTKVATNLNAIFGHVQDQFDLLRKSIHLADDNDLLASATRILDHAVWSPILSDQSCSFLPTDSPGERVTLACSSSLKLFYEKLVHSYGLDSSKAYLCIVASFMDHNQHPHLNSQVSEINHLLQTLHDQFNDLHSEIAQQAPGLSNVDILWQAIHCCPEFLHNPQTVHYLDEIRPFLTDVDASIAQECANFWQKANQAALCISKDCQQWYTDIEVLQMFIKKLLVSKGVIEEWRMNGVASDDLAGTIQGTLRMQDLWVQHVANTDALENFVDEISGNLARRIQEVMSTKDRCRMDLDDLRGLMKTLEEQLESFENLFGSFSSGPDLDDQVWDTGSGHTKNESLTVPLQIGPAGDAKSFWSLQIAKLDNMLEDISCLSGDVRAFDRTYLRARNTKPSNSVQNVPLLPNPAMQCIYSEHAIKQKPQSLASEGMASGHITPAEVRW
ncbi:hypothetical protein CVT24_008804 [Panaeolus cyanescens]|uniref:DUF6534 domain-containing protein n=1 Tax=Panaeolus cyanescens TaxID=181874 RepID=A0A409WWK9_9AGAR|nr:hypothetical protein CVT24_008804 [Panaeolus cyanescens]